MLVCNVHSSPGRCRLHRYFMLAMVCEFCECLSGFSWSCPEPARFDDQARVACSAAIRCAVYLVNFTQDLWFAASSIPGRVHFRRFLGLVTYHMCSVALAPMSDVSYKQLQAKGSGGRPCWRCKAQKKLHRQKKPAFGLM